MSSIVIYGSQYGTARQYAEELAKRTGFEVRQHDAVGNINAYDTVVFIGALYAGSVLGMKKTFAKLAGCQNKTIAIATVGLVDPADPEYIAALEDGMRKQLPEEVFHAASIFHLRGGIDHSQLSFKHRALLGLLNKQAKKLSEEEWTPEMRGVVETYGQRVSFVDIDSLEQIVAVLQLRNGFPICSYNKTRIY